MRIEADILAWLRQQGPEGYQSRLNALLRGVMLHDLETEAGLSGVRFTEFPHV